MSNAEAQIATNRATIEKFFDVCFTQFDAEATKPLLTDRYAQHNPMVPPGPEGFLALIPALKEAGMKIINHGMIFDGDFVVTRNLATNAQIVGHDAVVTFDIWRMVDGKLDEHWDSVHPKAEPNTSGRTQIDGDLEVRDLDKTEANRALVKEFAKTVLLGGQADEASKFVSADTFLEHNTLRSDGLDTYVAALKSGDFTYQTLHHCLAEGNLVFLMLEGHIGGQHSALYELFRVENGKIVEHWDSLEAVAEEWPHGTTKF